MKGAGCIFSKKASLTTEDLEQINHTRRPSRGELYTFSVVLCLTMRVDRDGERFTMTALHRLGELFLGKTGIFDHNPQVQNQAARIYACQVEQLPGRVTKQGRRTIVWLHAHIYRVLKKMKTFILELDSGIKKKSVSVVPLRREAVLSVGQIAGRAAATM